VREKYSKTRMSVIPTDECFFLVFAMGADLIHVFPAKTEVNWIRFHRFDRNNLVDPVVPASGFGVESRLTQEKSTSLIRQRGFCLLHNGRVDGVMGKQVHSRSFTAQRFPRMDARDRIGGLKAIWYQPAHIGVRY